MQTIGVDIDEVKCELMTNYLEFHNFNYGTKKSRKEIWTYNIWEIFNETREETVKKLDIFYKTKYFSALRPVLGSQEVIRELKKKYNLVSVTSRPLALEQQTRSWIEQHFGKSISEVYLTNQLGEGTKTTKAEICQSLGIKTLIEDSLEYSNECIERNPEMHILLRNCPWNQSQTLRPQINRFYHWREVPQLLQKLSSS